MGIHCSLFALVFAFGQRCWPWPPICMGGQVSWPCRLDWPQQQLQRPQRQPQRPQRQLQRPQRQPQRVSGYSQKLPRVALMMLQQFGATVVTHWHWKRRRKPTLNMLDSQDLDVLWTIWPTWCWIGLYIVHLPDGKQSCFFTNLGVQLVRWIGASLQSSVTLLGYPSVVSKLVWYMVWYSDCLYGCGF